MSIKFNALGSADSAIVRRTAIKLPMAPAASRQLSLYARSNIPEIRGSFGEFCAVQATPDEPTRKVLRIDSGALLCAAEGAARESVSAPSATPASVRALTFRLPERYLR